MVFDLKYTSAEIAQAINGVLVGQNYPINALSINSKESEKIPFCFFAIKGKRFNGINYVDEAISNGARLIVADEKIDCSVPVIYVDDTIRALGLLANKHKGKTRIIGVTGSNGKTTTKDMIVSVLKTKYSTCGTQDNFNNEIGVPLTLLSIKKEKFCVVEMGMRAQGEIEWLSQISEPETSIITNCGSAHIGLLGNKDNIFNAKTEILKYTKKYAILPNEQRFKKLNLTNLVSRYIGYGGDYCAKNVRIDANSLNFDVEKCRSIKLNSIYEHNVINALFAYAVAKVYGIDDEEFKGAIEKFSIGKSRGEIILINGIYVINDCYNASYESMKSAIKAIVKRFSNSNKKIAVLLGDMLELGDSTNELHTNIGHLCKELYVEKMFAFGQYASQYLLGFGKGEVLKDRESIAERMLNELNDNYVLLVKASNKVGLENVIDKMRELAK